MIEWKDFTNNNKEIYYPSNREITEIKCPECGEPLYRRIDIILTSYPPKYRYECGKCNWTGIA